MAAGNVAPSTPSVSVDLTVEDDCDAHDVFGPAVSGKPEICQKFGEHAKTFLKQMLAQHGGVDQCLTERFRKREVHMEFLTWAKKLWPLDADVRYDTAASLPVTTESECAQTKLLTFHPCSLGFGQQCTMRGPVENNVACELIDDIVTHGFRSGAEPVLLTQPAEMFSEKMPHVDGAFSHRCCSLGYYKGRSRCCVLLLVLDFARSHGYADLQEAMTMLSCSCCL